MATINYTRGNDTGTYTPLPAGTYQFIIREVTSETSKAGNPQIKLRLEVAEGPKAGRYVSAWYSQTPQAAWKLQRLFDALGIEERETGDYDVNGQPIYAVETDDLIDRAIQYEVTQDEYPAGSGRMNNRFNNECASPLEADDAEEQAVVAPQPAAQPAPQAAQTVGTMRRRPRPAQS